MNASDDDNKGGVDYGLCLFAFKLYSIMKGDGII
jgi:hypothetical protein